MACTTANLVDRFVDLVLSEILESERTSYVHIKKFLFRSSYKKVCNTVQNQRYLLWNRLIKKVITTYTFKLLKLLKKAGVIAAGVRTMMRFADACLMVAMYSPGINSC